MEVMIGIFIFIGILTLFYYLIIFLEIKDGYINNKKDFYLSLIPFYFAIRGIYRGIKEVINNVRNLK